MEGRMDRRKEESNEGHREEGRKEGRKEEGRKEGRKEGKEEGGREEGKEGGMKEGTVKRDGVNLTRENDRRVKNLSLSLSCVWKCGSVEVWKMK